jgi:hypothetical protein
VTEQRGLEHVVGDRRTVDRDERLAGAMRLLVDVARQHFLAGTGLAGNQHRGVAARDPRRQFEQLRTGRLERDRPLALRRAQTAQGMPRHQIEQALGSNGLTR